MRRKGLWKMAGFLEGAGSFSSLKRAGKQAAFRPGAT